MKRIITIRSATITTAITVMVAFFLPWVKVPSNISAWDFISGNTDGLITFPFKYLGVIIPLSALVIICVAVFWGDRIAGMLIYPVPLITMVTIIIITAFTLADNGIRIGSPYLPGILNITNIGFWVTLSGTILLAWLPRPVIKCHPAQ